MGVGRVHGKGAAHNPSMGRGMSKARLVEGVRCVATHTHAHMHAYAHTHTCTHTHVHVRTHTHKHAHMQHAAMHMHAPMPLAQHRPAHTCQQPQSPPHAGPPTRSAITKYRTEPRMGTLRYTSRAALMARSVSSASRTRALMRTAQAGRAVVAHACWWAMVVGCDEL